MSAPFNTHTPAFRSLLAALVVLAGAAALRAQSSPADAAQTAERIQREEQDRQREEQRRAREAGRAPTRIDFAAPVAPRAAADTGVRREIRELVLTGADHMRPQFRAQLLKTYTGQLGLADVERLLTDITRHYVLRGYSTTRAYLPEQDLSTGTLRVQVVEGRVQSIVGPGLTANVFPARPGELLDLRSLEQGIDNLNRLPSNNAALDLQPGAAPGDTIVAVRNQPGRRWRLSGSFDNSGSRDTGRDQASATLTLDDPAGYSDQVILNHRRSVPYRSGKEASESSSLTYSVPWGWQVLTVGGSASSYALQYFAPSGFPLPFDGTSRSANLRIDRGLRRTQTSQLTGYANLTWRSSKNYLMGSLIGVSSRDTSQLEAGVNYTTTWRQSTVNLSTALVAGLPILGATDDVGNLPAYAPHARYVKATFSASLSRAFTLGGQRLSFSTALNGQYSPRVLYGSDQLTIGGLYAVRGFDRINLAGDSGYVWRTDLALPLPVRLPFAGERPAIVRPYVGYDHGYAWSSATGLPAAFLPTEGSLQGAAAGLGLTAGRLNADVSYQFSLSRPGALADESGRICFRAGYTY